MEENKEIKSTSAKTAANANATAVSDKKPSRPNPAKATRPAGATPSQPSSSRPARPYPNNGQRPAFNRNNQANPNAPHPHFNRNNASTQPSDGSKPVGQRPRFPRPDGARPARPHFNKPENGDNAKKPLNPNATPATVANANGQAALTSEDEESKKVFVKKFKHNPKFKRPVKTGPELEEKVIEVKRISKTTKGGRKLRFSALVVVGDRKGTVGYGLAKANEVPDALKKAIRKAHNNLYKVKMTRAGSLFHEATGRSSSGKVLLKPAPEGTGIIAGGPIRAIVELAGYSDIYSKNQGTNASINMVRATINALMQQRTIKDVANARDLPINKLFH